MVKSIEETYGNKFQGDSSPAPLYNNVFCESSTGETRGQETWFFIDKERVESQEGLQEEVSIKKFTLSIEKASFLSPFTIKKSSFLSSFTLKKS